MVKSLALAAMTVFLAACPTDPPHCVLLACDSGAQCPNGVCGSDGICVYDGNADCTDGGTGSTTSTTSGSSSSAATTSTAGSTAGITGSSITGGPSSGGLTSGGRTSGGLTSGGNTSGGQISSGGSGGSTGSMGDAGPCAQICGHCDTNLPCCNGASCDMTVFLCPPPQGGVGQCTGGMTSGGGTTTGGGQGSCKPLSNGDAGYCMPIDAGCPCYADYDCCSGGCCDLTGWPGVCVSNGGISPGFHRGPQPSGGSAGLGGCGIPLCSPLGGSCATMACCGSSATPPVSCPANSCCQPFDGGCVTDQDCCGGQCDSSSLTCR